MSKIPRVFTIRCRTCGGLIYPLEGDPGAPDPYDPCSCDVIRNVKDLREHGYTDAPEARFAGGPLKLRRPDGTIVSEEDFGLEIECLIEKTCG